MNRKTQAWIVIPAFREEKRISSFIHDLVKTLKSVSDQNQFHILVVNDGSPDQTAASVQNLETTFTPDFTVQCISLLRNFGHQSALVCGLLHAAKSGADFAVTMDADGEHPPKVILEMIQHWKKGEPLVHTLRKKNENLSFFKRITSNAFYSIMSFGSIQIKTGMADFKIWDGELLREVSPFLTSCGSIRLFAAWLAPQGACVEFDQVVIEDRTSRFTLKKMMSLAFRGFFSYSDFPLRLSTAFGAISIAFGLIYLVFVIVSFIMEKNVPGWTSLTLLITFFGGIQVFCIGILGEYLIQRNFRSLLPTFVIRPNRNHHLNIK